MGIIAKESNKNPDMLLQSYDLVVSQNIIPGNNLMIFRKWNNGFGIIENLPCPGIIGFFGNNLPYKITKNGIIF